MRILLWCLDRTSRESASIHAMGRMAGIIRRSIVDAIERP